MPIMFNFKICDNAAACNGISACPVKAIAWDEKNQTLLANNSICTSCGTCAKACPVEGAILVAKDFYELKRLEEQVEDFPGTRAELLEDRYGSFWTDANLLLDEKNFADEVLKTDRVAIVEFWNDNSINCRVKSPSYKQVVPREVAVRATAGQKCVRFKIRKVNVDKNKPLGEKYGVKTLPSLLFFWKGREIHRIEGFIPIDQVEKLKQEIKTAVEKIK